jgi:oligo-1,6-glucosidase
LGQNQRLAALEMPGFGGDFVATAPQRIALTGAPMAATLDGAPLQWNATTHAGFTTGTPWIKVNPNYKTLNAAAQEKDPNSCLNYFRSLVKIRKANPVLVYGKYTLLDKSNPTVYAYTREEGNQKMLIVLNFSATDTQVNTGLNLVNAKMLLNNYKEAPVNNISQSVISLRPYEAIIYTL